MILQAEALTNANLEEVVAFLRESNPFAQKTWGWDTGRFMDWRWGSNTIADQQEPGWFSTHCTLFRDRVGIKALAIAEEGHDDTCIITSEEDPDSVRSVVDWLIGQRVGRNAGLRFEAAERAVWLAAVLRECGLIEERGTGNEWEYDLSTLPEPVVLAEGFTIAPLGIDRAADYRGIADCISAAFNTDRDVQPVLEGLEANPMFRPELSVFARSPEGRIAAYCRGTVDAGNGVCGIDPVCCHPDFQRMGLSKAVVQACLRTQRDLGGRFTYIGSAPEPAPGTFLYRSLGPSDVATASTWTMNAP